MKTKTVKTYTFSTLTPDGVAVVSEGLSLKEVLHRLKAVLPHAPNGWTTQIITVIK